MHPIFTCCIHSTLSDVFLTCPVKINSIFDINSDFSIEGIWPEGADGTDINACCRSSNHEYLVTGDDFGQVNFFNYPSTKPKVRYILKPKYFILLR